RRVTTAPRPSSSRAGPAPGSSRWPTPRMRRARWPGCSTPDIAVRHGRGMYDIAEQVRAWVAGGRPVLIGQVVATRGFSSRDPGAALAWSGTDCVGGLMAVIDRDLVGTTVGGRLVDVSVSDADA